MRFRYQIGLLFAILLFSFSINAQSTQRHAGETSDRAETLGSAVTVTAVSQNAEVGDVISVVYTATNLTGLNALGFEGRMQFDPSILQFNSCSTIGTIFSHDGPICNLDPTPDVLFTGVFGSIPASGSGPIMIVNFTVIGSVGDVSPLNFQYFFFNEGNPSSVLVNGTVTVVDGPTAAHVSVEGQVLTAGGSVIRNATVIVIDDENRSFTARTNTFGFFRIGNLDAGRSYIISAVARGHSFPAQTVTLNQQATTFNLIAGQ